MRFLATGDLQCHAWRQFSYTRKDGMNSRLYNCLLIFDIIWAEAKARGISKLLLNGDIFEENAFINVEVYSAVYDRIERLHRKGMEIVINLGNHDVLREHGKRMLHSLRAFRKVAHVVEEPTLVWDCLQVVPWMSDSKRLKKIIRSIESNNRHGLVLHCGVQGARTGPKSYLVRNPIKLQDVRGRYFSFVLLSDYHTRQYLSSNVFYMGSPLQHSFGETHRPCIWDMVLDGREYTAKKIYTNLPRFQTVALGGDSKSREKLKEKLSSFQNDYVRIRIGASSKITDREIESAVGGKFLFQIERKEDSLEADQVQSVHTLAPEEAISRYTEFHTNSGNLKRLVQLGKNLYKGEM